MRQNRNTRGREHPGRTADDVWERYLLILEKESGVKLTVSGTGKTEPFASMDYSEELEVKARAFSAFIHGSGMIFTKGDIIPSPMPRQYRTTTKRRARYSSNHLVLSSDESSPVPAESLLEPEAHSRIYSHLLRMLNEPINRHVSRILNFVIIRGNYTEFTVIFNVSALRADIVKGCGKVAERLRVLAPSVSSAFIYHDPSGSRYYFESIQPADGLKMKRIFGHANLAVRAKGILYTFHPAGFSQVNFSMADKMLEQAEMLLAPGAGGEVVDLYCGYGFFSCFFSGSVSSVTGIDYDRNAVEHAKNNIKRLHNECRWKFTSAAVEPEILAKILPRGKTGEYILLDPPRRGTRPGVIETLAERKPVRVLHIFCGVETVPAEVKRWADCGYRVRKVSVLDMFPGTANLEVMVMLE